MTGHWWPAVARRATAACAAAALALSLAACAGSGPASSAASASGVPASDSGAAAPGSDSAAVGQASTTPDPAAAALAAAFERLSAGYTFDSTVTVAGVVATSAQGRWTDGASEFVLTSGGASVTYRSVPPDAWVQQADGSWVKLDGPAPGGDPLGVLANPQTVARVASDGNGTQLQATYPAADLLGTGDGAVTVSLTIGADGSLAVSYTSATATGSATSATTIGPSPSQKPIIAPSG